MACGASVGGGGHLCQGRFKACPVEPGSGLLTVCRHVERNALFVMAGSEAAEWPFRLSELSERGGLPRDRRYSLVNYRTSMRTDH